MTRACLAAVSLLLAMQTFAWGQTSVQTTDVTRSAGTAQPAGRFAKFAGSSVQLATYVGSGSFYVSGYRNPYASLAFYAGPSYDLGTRFKLAVNARMFIEEELTTPDNSTAQRFYVYDPWVWLAAQNLHTFERTKIRLGASCAACCRCRPRAATKHDRSARDRHRDQPRVRVRSVNDEARKWSFVSAGRPSSPSTSTRATSAATARATAPAAWHRQVARPTSARAVPRRPRPIVVAARQTPTTPSPNTFVAGLTRGKVSGFVSLFITNSLKYGFPDDALHGRRRRPGRTRATPRGASSGLGYQVRPHVGVLDRIVEPSARARLTLSLPAVPLLRFLGGANANNYTQVFVSVNGTL